MTEEEMTEEEKMEEILGSLSDAETEEELAEKLDNIRNELDSFGGDDMAVGLWGLWEDDEEESVVEATKETQATKETEAIDWSWLFGGGDEEEEKEEGDGFWDASLTDTMDFIKGVSTPAFDLIKTYMANSSSNVDTETKASENMLKLIQAQAALSQAQAQIKASDSGSTSGSDSKSDSKSDSIDIKEIAIYGGIVVAGILVLKSILKG